MRLADCIRLAAEKYGDKPAFLDEKNSISFAGLYEKALELSKSIEGRNRAVLVDVGRNAESLVRMFAVVLSGNAYVPIDEKAPKQRREEIAAQIQDADCTGLAYILFTSGSTGKPKGVEIYEESVLNFMDSFTEAFGIDENTVFGNQAPFYFDASMEEIYGTLKCGCTCHILPPKFFLFPKLFAEYINENKINRLNLATTAFNLIAGSGVLEKYSPKYLKTVIVGGETMRAKQLNIWRKYCPDTEFVNAYGPTEVTVECTYYRVDRAFADDEDIPIGRPCRGVEIFLRDGEMLVASKGLARGYLKDPEKTAEAFIEYEGRRVYCTGDFVRTDAFGNYVYAGRRDNQIKHAGVRIELGELESALAPFAREVCCVFYEEADRIVCFYSGDLSEKDMAAAARRVLPSSMLPGEYVKKDVLPKNANDKIDRKKLKDER